MKKVAEAIGDTLKEIIAAIKWVLGRIPPELAADVLENGIFLTGGSAALPNLDSMIASEFGVPVSVARDAGECRTLGAGYMADHFDMLGGASKGET
jgi:rod shape-determining protein MreB